LQQFAQKLTTLSAVYQSVEAICDAHGLTHFDEKHRVNRPPNSELEAAYIWSATWWSLVLEGLKPLKDATNRPYLIPEMRQYREKSSLLFRPVTHIALFRAISRCVTLGLGEAEAVQRMNRINWRASANTWEDILIRANGHMMTSQQSIRLAGRLIAYMVVADLMTDQAIDELKRDHAVARGWSPHTPGRQPALPKPVKV
jgi:DNA sulfur modification protein DndB